LRMLCQFPVTNHHSRPVRQMARTWVAAFGQKQACSWQQNPAYTSHSFGIRQTAWLPETWQRRRLTAQELSRKQRAGGWGMKRRTFITLLAVSSVAACARPVHATIRGLTMGTSYTVELAAPIGGAVRTRLAELIEVELAAINRAMSTYDPRSELSAFNSRQDLRWTPASRGLLEVLDSASRISTATMGAFRCDRRAVDRSVGIRPTIRYPASFRTTTSSSGFGTASATSTCKPIQPPGRSERDTVAPRST